MHAQSSCVVYVAAACYDAHGKYCLSSTFPEVFAVRSLEPGRTPCGLQTSKKPTYKFSDSSWTNLNRQQFSLGKKRIYSEMTEVQCYVMVSLILLHGDLRKSVACYL